MNARGRLSEKEDEKQERWENNGCRGQKDEGKEK